MGSIPGSERSPEEGNGNPLQYSCLENSMDRGAWEATDHGIAKSQTWLSNFIYFFFLSSYASMTAYFNSVSSLPLLLSLLDVSYVKYHNVLQKIFHMPLILKCFPVYSPLSHPTARGMFLKCIIMILLYFKFLQHSTCI